MERFRELLSQIATHEKQLESAKKAGEESVKKKDAQMKRVLRREAEVKRTVGEQKTIIRNLASIWKSRRIGQKYIRRKDQQRNLQLLEEAMKANEISQELYEVQNRNPLWKDQLRRIHVLLMNSSPQYKSLFNIDYACTGDVCRVHNKFFPCVTLA